MADRRQYKTDTDEAKARCQDVDDIAEAAWQAAGMYWNREISPDGQWMRHPHFAVSLVQRRLSDPFGFEYIAVKT